MPALMGEMPLSTVAVIQIITAVCSAVTALIGVVVAAQKWPALVNWFKSHQALIGERNGAIGRLVDMTARADFSHQLALEMKLAVDTFRSDNAELRERVESLEKMRPIYDANLEWTPLAIEYIAWMEGLAKINEWDLGGRSMPPLPPILVDYFKRPESRA